MTTLSLFTNRATAKLAVDVSSGDTALTLVPNGGEWFPTPGPNQFFRLVLQKGSGQTDQREYMVCTSRAGDVLTVERGLEGTPAANFIAGDEVSLVATALTMTSFVQRAGATLQGALEVEAPPTTPLGIANKDYVDTASIDDVPNDGKTYGRQFGLWDQLGDAAQLPIPIPIGAGGTGGISLSEAQLNLVIARTSIDDLAPASPRYGDRWIKPSNMTELVWVPNQGGTGGAGVWINPMDSQSEAYPIPISKGGTGATTLAQAQINLGILDFTTTVLKISDGTKAAPGLAWNSEPGLGWFRKGVSDVGYASQGQQVMGVNSQPAAATFFYLGPRSTGSTSLQIFSTLITDATNARNMSLGIDPNGAYIDDNASGTAVHRPLNFRNFTAVTSTANINVVSGPALAQDANNSWVFMDPAQTAYIGWNKAGAKALYFVNNGNISTYATDGTLTIANDIIANNMALGGTKSPNPYVRFTVDGWKLVYDAGRVLWQNPSSRNLALIDSLGSFVSSKGAGEGASFVTSGDIALRFNSNAFTSLEIARGNPNVGVEYNMVFQHVPGTWAGIQFNVGANVGYQFRNDGQAGATVAGPWSGLVSDARVKDRIEDYDEGLEAILALRVREFSFREGSGMDPKARHIGLIAQESGPLKQPAFINKMGGFEYEDMLTYDIRPINWQLVNAIKTLHARVRQLETQ